MKTFLKYFVALVIYMIAAYIANLPMVQWFIVSTLVIIGSSIQGMELE